MWSVPLASQKCVEVMGAAEGGRTSEGRAALDGTAALGTYTHPQGG